MPVRCNRRGKHPCTPLETSLTVAYLTHINGSKISGRLNGDFLATLLCQHNIFKGAVEFLCYKKGTYFLGGNTNSHPELSSSIVSVESMANDINMYQTQMVLFDFK